MLLWKVSYCLLILNPTQTRYFVYSPAPVAPPPPTHPHAASDLGPGVASVGRRRDGAAALLDVGGALALGDLAAAPGLELEEGVGAVDDHRDEAEEGRRRPGLVDAAPGGARRRRRQEEETPQGAVAHLLRFCDHNKKKNEKPTTSNATDCEILI